MDDKGSVGKISVSSDSVSTLNSEDFVLVSRLGDETPSSTNNGSDDEKTGLKVRRGGCRDFRSFTVTAWKRHSMVSFHLSCMNHSSSHPGGLLCSVFDVSSSLRI